MDDLQHYMLACARLRGELEDAKIVARRLLRERDEARENYSLATDELDRQVSQVNHLESDRDALAKQVDEYRTVLEWVEGQKRSELSIYYRDIIREVQKALRKA